MAICDLNELNGLLAAEARLMGLDLGAKTIGIAVSDVSRTIATARTTLRRTKLSRDIETLRALIETEGIGGIVVGLPVNMDGSEGPRAQSARDTAARLAEALALPVAFWDERWSTVAAERAMLDADLSRRKRARKVDQVAAAYILQGALDRGLLVAPVTTLDEVVNSEQLASRDYWTSVDHGQLGRAIRYPGPFAKFSAAPITYRRRPPRLGEHNHEIYGRELGLSPAQLDQLQTKGVI